MTKREPSNEPSGRPNRRHLNVVNRLEIINKDPNRVYRLINNTPERIYRFIDQLGYRVEDIKKHLPGQARLEVSSIVDNAIAVGGGQMQILVSIEKEIYEEDQRYKQERVDQTEEAIQSKSDGQYGNIQIGKGR